MCVSTYCSLTIELQTKRPLIMDYGADAHIVHSPLQLYEGDCDNDSECASGLKCFDRDNDSECASGLKCFHSDEFSQIPSCNGNGIEDYDYYTHPLITDYGVNVHIDHSPLQLCEGSCNDDSECASGLKCFHSDEFS